MPQAPAGAWLGTIRVTAIAATDEALKKLFRLFASQTQAKLCHDMASANIPRCGIDRLSHKQFTKPILRLILTAKAG
jgi:hypothetical protein